MNIFGGKLQLDKKTQEVVDRLYEYLINYSDYVVDKPDMRWLDYLEDWRPQIILIFMENLWTG